MSKRDCHKTNSENTTKKVGVKTPEGKRLRRASSKKVSKNNKHDNLQDDQIKETESEGCSKRTQEVERFGEFIKKRGFSDEYRQGLPDYLVALKILCNTAKANPGFVTCGLKRLSKIDFKSIESEDERLERIFKKISGHKGLTMEKVAEALQELVKKYMRKNDITLTSNKN